LQNHCHPHSFTHIPTHSPSSDAKELVVKAQIHAGGRGKGVFDNGFKGGVHLCKTSVQRATGRERDRESDGEIDR
jgi:succinyl-CoA synthetase beta subunit